MVRPNDPRYVDWVLSGLSPEGKEKRSKQQEIYGQVFDAVTSLDCYAPELEENSGSLSFWCGEFEVECCDLTPWTSGTVKIRNDVALLLEMDVGSPVYCTQPSAVPLGNWTPRFIRIVEHFGLVPPPCRNPVAPNVTALKF